MVSLRVWLASSLVVLQLLFTKTLADGTGLIGFGKTLYNPTCTFACRNVIRKQKLTCTPSSSTENHGTAHNPVSTPPKCFVQDPTFLKTMALCINVYCKLSDKPPMDLVEDYWASHLGTGTLGDYQYRPLMSYSNALRAARKDEEEAKASGNVTKSTPATVPPGLRPYQVTSPLGFTIGGSASLNQTRLVDPLQWQLQWNYLSDFERNEKGHSMMTIIIAVVAITLPILLSLLRHVPFLTRSHGWSYVNSIMIHPAVFGTRHRESVLGAIVPTRGQTLYIVLMSFLNIILLLAPYTITQPQASFTTLMKQSVSIVGNRAGTMAMGNVVALVLFSSRNSFLLYTTEWSYGTFLLFHRWLGYWAVAHTVIHSCMLWSYYVDAGTYAAEILRLYWVWGIVGTVAACALLLLSLPVVRKKMYELFVVSHIALSLLFLIGYYYHIWYVYEYKWGYEIWMFVAAGIWALERVVRIVRMATQGSCTALVTVVPDTDGDYVRIEVEGKDYKDGVTYLCFPTLSWRFWESHPFSVSGICADPGSEISQSSGSHEDLGSATTIEKEATQQMVKSPAASDPDVCSESRRTIFFARTRDGVTKVLKERATSANSQQIRVRVLVDGPYNHSGRIQSQIARCGSVICIAGGVGITACLPILKEGGVCDKKLFWSSRKSGLVAEVRATLSAQGASLKVETLIGERFDLDAILNDALRADESNGVEPVAIVVSGPPALADNVRQLTTQIARTSGSSRAYVLVDEAFGW